MSNWQAPPPLHDDDLEAADRLLDQANALLRRHRGTDAPSADATPRDGDDLPILTDVVDESDPGLPLLVNVASLAPPAGVSAPVDSPAADAPPATGPAASISDELAEQLVRLDTELNREIKTWVETEFPQILGRELDRLTERMQAEMLAHLRATLLPELSERISRLLDHTGHAADHPDGRRHGD